MKASLIITAEDEDEFAKLRELLAQIEGSEQPAKKSASKPKPAKTAEPQEEEDPEEEEEAPKKPAAKKGSATLEKVRERAQQIVEAGGSSKDDVIKLLVKKKFIKAGQKIADIKPEDYQAVHIVLGELEENDDLPF